MNILVVVTDLFFPDFSGGARRTIETARTLTRLGHQVIIVCNRRPNDLHHEKIENFEVYRVRMIDFGEKIRHSLGKIVQMFLSLFKRDPSVHTTRASFDSHLDRISIQTPREKLTDWYRHKFPLHKILKWIPAIFPIFKLIKQKKIDIVYERGPSYGAGVLSAYLLGRPSILDFIDVMYWNFALRKCSRILSYFTHYQIPSFIDRSKIDMVYICADIDHFNPNRIKASSSEKLSKTMGIYTGAFYHWHGLDYLVQAVAYLKKEYKDWIQSTDFSILLVGRGEYYEYIKDFIHTVDVDELIHIHDRISFDLVPYFLNQADFCISLNTGDALGLKVFEYMAMGKPILISNIDIVPKILSEEVVYMVDPTKPIDIAHKIMEIVNNPEESRKKGQKARKLAEQKHSWKRHGQNMQRSFFKAIKAHQKV